MTLIFVGASYHNISLADLEMLERSTQKMRDIVFNSTPTESAIEASVLVSTCNRFEIYCETENEELTIQYLTSLIENESGVTADKILIKRGEEVTHHLFRVTSGLESMIVGEVEIAGQVKRSFALSQEAHQTSRIIELLFQRSFEISKKVSTQTGLGAAGRSLINSGLDIMTSHGFDIAGKHALVIGTGAYARVVIAALQRAEIGDIGVYSPSNRAEEFASNHGVRVIFPDSLHEAIKNTDMIIACSGIHGTVITEEDIRELRERTLPIIDLSLSRDVEKSVQHLPHVTLIDLEEIGANAPAEHHEIIENAASIIESGVTEFHNDLRARRNDPYIRLLRTHVQSFVDDEVERVRKKKGDAIAQEVEYSLQLVTKSIFHKPMLAARESAVSDGEFDYEKAISQLFGISVTEVSDE